MVWCTKTVILRVKQSENDFGARCTHQAKHKLQIDSYFVDWIHIRLAQNIVSWRCLHVRHSDNCNWKMNYKCRRMDFEWTKNEEKHAHFYHDWKCYEQKCAGCKQNLSTIIIVMNITSNTIFISVIITITITATIITTKWFMINVFYWKKRICVNIIVNLIGLLIFTTVVSGGRTVCVINVSAFRLDSVISPIL